VAIGAIGILGLTVLASEDASILQGQRSLAPAGVELSDDELLQVEGELAPLVVLALGVVSSAAFGAGADLAWQAGFGDGDINWIQVGCLRGLGCRRARGWFGCRGGCSLGERPPLLGDGLRCDGARRHSRRSRTRKRREDGVRSRYSCSSRDR
jgi:hypothetical protein